MSNIAQRAQQRRRRRQSQQNIAQPNQNNVNQEPQIENAQQMDEESQPQQIVPNQQLQEQVNEIQNQMDQPQQNQQQPQNQQQQPQQNQQQQQQQQQQEPELQNLSQKRFLMKIPNSAVLRDFFINKGQFYCPPLRDMNQDFMRKILKGEKRFLKTNQVLYIDQVPKWKEFSAKALWQKAQSSPCYLIHFPDLPKSRQPERRYLLNIINTVSRNSVADAIKKKMKEKLNNVVEEQPIQLTQEMNNLFEQFTSICTDQKQRGLRLRQKKEYDQCMLCLSLMKQKRTIANFACLKHSAHKRCLIKYMKSENGKTAQQMGYLCPLKCSLGHM